MIIGYDNKVFRRIGIALSIVWALVVCSTIHCPAVRYTNILKTFDISNRGCSARFELEACVTPLSDRGSLSQEFIVVIASTRMFELAPEMGLVLPGTKDRKPVHDTLFKSTGGYMLFWVVPCRNFRGIAHLARLSATRNQYRRVDFMYAYNGVSRFIWYSDCYQFSEKTNKCIKNSCSIPPPHRFGGGGGL